MLETIGEQSKPWKPDVQFSEFPLNPHGYRPAARMIYDPECGRVANFLRGVFKSTLQPALLSKMDMPLEEAIEATQALSPTKHIKDPSGRTWELFVYQPNMFFDQYIIERETDELIVELATRMLLQRLEIARMEAGLHILATTFWPASPSEH